MSALSQIPNLGLWLLGGISLLMLLIGLVWRTRSPREDARAKVKREALVPISDAMVRGPAPTSAPARTGGSQDKIARVPATSGSDPKIARVPARTAEPNDPPPASPAAAGPVRVRGPARAATSATAARQAAKSALLAGDVRVAADAYRGAGLIDEAVNLLVGVLGAPEEAAAMLVTVGRHERAAELFQSAGMKREAAEQWAEVARRSAQPGKLIESIAALDWDVARDLALELAKKPDHPDAAAIRRAAALFDTMDFATRPAPKPAPTRAREEEVDPAHRLSEEETDALVHSMTLRDSAPDERHPSIPPARQSLPSIVEAPFEDENPADLAALTDETVLFARVGPTVDQLSAYVKGPCTSANTEVHFRVAAAMIARGAWDQAAKLLDGIYAVQPDFRDVLAKSSAIALWRKRLGTRRFLAANRYELVGEWRRHRHAITFRGIDLTEKRDVLLHRLGNVRSVEAAFDACPALRAFQTLLHPNVARVYDAFADELGRIVVVTELTDASSLRERVARSPLPVAECLRVAVEVASACEHLHSRGLGMTELHPGCVSSVPGGVVKLEPLGFGALLDGDGDHARHVAPYVPPEGMEQHDERCTVYALGAILFNAITQREPRLDEPVTVDSLKDLKVPGAFANILARAMARNPAERFPSSNGMRLTLRSLLRQVHGRASMMKIPAAGG
jgi:hypothetical protein